MFTEGAGVGDGGDVTAGLEKSTMRGYGDFGGPFTQVPRTLCAALPNDASEHTRVGLLSPPHTRQT